MTEYEKLLAGLHYNGGDPEIFAKQAAGQAQKAVLDAIPMQEFERRVPALQALFGSMAGPCMIHPPFNISFGSHIHMGKWCFVNAGATFLDDGLITLGDFVAIGPNVQLITATHPLRPEDRFTMKDEGFPPFEVANIAKPITIESHVWIGAGAIILPGITIGAGAVVGAGSVVTKDVAPRMVVAGNPARVIKSVDD